MQAQHYRDQDRTISLRHLRWKKCTRPQLVCSHPPGWVGREKEQEKERDKRTTVCVYVCVCVCMQFLLITNLILVVCATTLEWCLENVRQTSIFFILSELGASIRVLIWVWVWVWVWVGIGIGIGIGTGGMGRDSHSQSRLRTHLFTDSVDWRRRDRSNKRDIGHQRILKISHVHKGV